jgi:hypothetical protein
MKCARVQGLVKLNQLWKRGPFARRSRFPKTLRGKTALNTRHFPRRTKAPDRLFDYLNSASCGRAASSPRIQMHLNQDCVVTATTRVGGSPIVCVACAREAVEMQRHAETHRHAPRNLREGASPKALPEHTQRVSELCRQKKISLSISVCFPSFLMNATALVSVFPTSAKTREKAPPSTLSEASRNRLAP